ncbi:ArsR/SmtB family transcription factor [Methanoplanus limicola]|uniref:Regulatory protein ArsR n=1 Tax=Methanoplanus limicola DSM 2279 TaxID=937775 RepID=H1YZD4_9EURY|nr:winged helix-turn-helix domain-containing protein [Methanoplanus limicola]EHQ35158.1 regulatory protein ArsR [Methanoplanus limicola DSM 2279]
MEDSEYIIDKNIINSLSSDTRINVLKLLSVRKKTNSELSKDLSLQESTVHYHLKKMESAGLIISKEDGHKWIYYELTPFGKAVTGSDNNSRFSIIISSILNFTIAFAAIYTYYTIPRLQMSLSIPLFDDPYFPLFIIAIGAVVLQIIILWKNRVLLKI